MIFIIAGYCAIDWSVSGTSSPDPFQIDDIAGNNGMISEANCDLAFVEIPGSVLSDADNTRGSNVYCGDHLNTLSNSMLTSSVIRSYSPSFLIRFFSNNGNQNNLNGYNLDYNQVPCAAAGST